MPKTRLKIDDRAVRQRLDALGDAAVDLKPAWKEFGAYMRVVTDRQFAKLRKGGTYRGVTWKPFAPQYVRRDGTVVPAWGGVPKVRGKRYKTGKRAGEIRGKKVKGRLRPSNSRITKRSALMQDTGTMKGRAALTTALRRKSVEMGPQGVRYAKEQNDRRPFLFFDTPKDARVLVRIIRRHLGME